ncbi:MAG: DUF4034 domain-containing protein [Xanthomonadaceae bacterium]|nr:DUF4034 domain-containing protein [Xanthomonadaceae bacterium]
MLVVFSAMPASAQSNKKYKLPLPDERVDASRFEDFKSPWREHLLRVREVLKIEDPLQRCLAWPDLPGSQWPAGHAASHCRHYHDDSVGIYTLDWLESLLSQGDLAAINAALNKRLELHFKPEPGFHEAIHFLFDKIEADDRSDALTSRWLRAAPDDAYALLARATFYRKEAWKARGARYAAKTPASQMSRMSELAERSVPLYRKAIAINPRLMPAYEGMLNVATADSLDAVAEEAIKGAQKQDPACPAIARERMRAMQPRWGGSYEAMDAYATELDRLTVSRPLLALYVGAPFADASDMAGDQEGREAEELAVKLSQEAIRRGSNLTDLSDAASRANILHRRNKLSHEGIGDSVAMALQYERFHGRPPSWTLNWLAHVFVRRDPAMALRYADMAIGEEPESTNNQYILAASLYNTGQPEPADYYYRLAMEDKNPDMRLTALREVAQMWIGSPDVSNEVAVTRGAPYVAVLEKEYPKEGRAGFLRLALEHRRNGRVEVDSMRKALAGHDASDHWQAEKAEDLRKTLESAPQVP